MAAMLKHSERGVSSSVVHKQQRIGLIIRQGLWKGRVPGESFSLERCSYNRD